ncbi:MAG: 16S rRNA (adenine(1518)-N(6)/adenine(1519)-N(6))-dimethyltransferase RsmA [Acidobacteriota bacterium]
MSRQKLGQHFLASSKVLQRIIKAAGASGASLAVEIGPGKGALTQHLLDRFERVIAIELDRDLAQVLRDRWGQEPRLEIVERNALQVRWTEFGAGVLAGNLPYYVATAIISSFVREPGLLGPGIFLIQKEVAERITATPGHREYGYLTVECQLLAKAEYLFNVPPGAFQPAPKVDSAVIRLTPVPPPPDIQVPAFLKFASGCFRQKRKTLRNNLSPRYPREMLDLRPEMGRRAEQLTVSEFLDLYRFLEPAAKPDFEPL